MKRDLCIVKNRHVRAALSTLAALLIYCGMSSPLAADSGPFHLLIGFSSKAFISAPREDIRIAVQVLSKKVARKTVGSAESKVYDSTIDMEKDLKSRKLDVVALTPEEYMYLRDRTPLEAVMSTVSGKSHEFEMLLLVRKDSGLKSVADLKKKSIGLPSRTTQFGNVYTTWIETLVMKEGVGSMGDYFSSVTEARSSSQSIMSVFFRKIDGCVVPRHAFEVTAELNPQIARDLKTISRIDRLTGGIIAFRQDLPEERKQKVRQALMTLHEDQEGHQMFVLFQLDRLIPFRPEYLKGTEMLYAEHARQKKTIVARRTGKRP